MSYLKNGTEYLDADEFKVYQQIVVLNAANRTTNNSQVASAAGLPRTRVAGITGTLKRRGFIKDVSKGAAYHWRVTAKAAQMEKTP